MTTLYSLAVDGAEIEMLLLDSLGEITPAIQEALDNLLVSGVDKIEAAAAVVRQLQMSAMVAEEESERLRQRAKDFESQAQQLKDRMTVALDLAFHGKIKTPKWTIYTQKNADRIVADLVPGVTAEMLHKERPDLVRVKMELDRPKVVEEYKAKNNVEKQLSALGVMIEEYKKKLKSNPGDVESAEALRDARQSLKDRVDALASLPVMPELILFENKIGERSVRIK